MTPLQIETASRYLLNADNDTLWSSTEIIEVYLYFCCQRMAQECRVIENVYTTPSVASQEEYTFPSKSIGIYRVTYDGNKLENISNREVGFMNLTPSTLLTGTPQFYWTFGNTIHLFHAPDTDALDIKIYSFDNHDAITSSSTLEIPTQYHESLCYGVAMMMAGKEVGGEARYILFRDKWDMEIARIKQLEKLKKRTDKFARVKTEEMMANTFNGII